MINLKELRELAVKAMPGPWEHHNWDVMERPHIVAHSLWNGKDHCNGHFDIPCTTHNTEYIAALSPDTTLKLIEAIEVMTEALWYYKHVYPEFNLPHYTEKSINALARVEELLK